MTLTRIDQETGEEEEVACLLFNKIEGNVLSDPDEATIAFLADLGDMTA